MGGKQKAGERRIINSSWGKWNVCAWTEGSQADLRCRELRRIQELEASGTLSLFSCSGVSDSFVIPWTVACQFPLSMGFLRQEYWFLQNEPAIVLRHFSHVWLCVKLWTIAYQVPLSMGFSRQEYWSGCHFLLQGIFLIQGSNWGHLHWQVDSLPLSHQGTQSGMLGGRKWEVVLKRQSLVELFKGTARLSSRVRFIFWLNYQRDCNL